MFIPLKSHSQSSRYPCPAEREADGDKGNEGSENEIDRVTVDEDEAQVSYHAERLRADNLIGLEHICQSFKN